MKKKITAVLLALSMLTAPAVFNESADVPFSVNAEAATTKKLAKPTNVKASVKNGKITLSWKKVKGAEAYSVYKYDSAKKKYVKLKTTKNTKYTVTAKGSGTYKFRIYSMDLVDGKYKKGDYAYKTAKVSADKFKEQFSGITLGMTKQQIINVIGDDYLIMDDMIMSVYDDDGEYKVYFLEGGRLKYYGFCCDYSKAKYDEYCNYFDDNGWTSNGGTMEGSLDARSYAADVFIKDGLVGMVMRDKENDTVFCIITDTDL